MRAVRFHGKGDLRCEEIAVPAALKPGEARLKVRAAGICGSDLHNFRTGMWVSRLPVTPGHEFAAEVIELGEGVGELAVGDLVVADSRATCGVCASCMAGQANLCLSIGYIGEVCDGGFAEQTVLPARGLLRVPPGVDPEIAALSEPLAVALRVVNRLEAAVDQPVLIAGGGPIGGLTALLLAEFGHCTVLLAERNPARAKLLADVAGAEPIGLDSAAIATRCPGGPRYCVEATGSAAVLSRLIESVAAGCRIVMVGIFHEPGEVDLNRLVEREIELRGSAVFRDEQAQAVALLPRLAPKLAKLISAPIGLSDVPSAYERLIRGETADLKTIVRP
jgi:(R,R)-butanediol dehydrogenase/meso-butanediol dehydrogenase/diacetyl reductase